MLCPTCKQPMIVVEHEGIELDHCLTCQGTWFDAGELELLFQDLKAEEETVFSQPLESLPAAETSEARRRCPRCRKKMKKVFVGDDLKILLDLCPRGEGFWFDAGEVGQFIEETLARLPGAAGKVIAFLGEAFRAPSEEGGET